MPLTTPGDTQTRARKQFTRSRDAVLALPVWSPWYNQQEQSERPGLASPGLMEACTSTAVPPQMRHPRNEKPVILRSLLENKYAPDFQFTSSLTFTNEKLV